MTESALTPEQILRATEDVLRRYGPAKATVVDVARALGVSHGSVYRHFASKAALREAVTERWLDRAHRELAGITAEDGPAADRLHRWLLALFTAKRRKALDDPELFATYTALIGQTASTVVERHLETLVGQLAAIVADGVAQGVFAACDVRAAARAVFQATARFHDPCHAAEWTDPRTDADLEAVWALLLNGLAAR
ncbi:TetR family transcriptional regulator [Streptacidiphilus sp. ASG 303]|uniref:TetR family transcriptional regulator n=1 Tax=Streptacidiphilus sp. ASG 303 TaxID=2896847 RepID=UPI001E649858|nr:TetR family transcriptional regulator [Streptacidiphilus sp. ASG 303]MCD0485197.1 TetR family transcriptional regulator [Streptacidiphilus sp. ASG 303]